MGRMNLKERIKQDLLILDGAMGTELIARGIEPGKCSDYLNIRAPDIIFDIHLAYLQAGCDAILTNTFGANRIALARHGLDKKVSEINLAGAEIGRQASGNNKYVLGDIGPSGDFLEPLGNVRPDQLRTAFAEQAKSLLDGGVDGFIIETMTALDEATIAVEAVKSICQLPVFASFGFDRAGGDYRTMMGVSVEAAVSKMISLDVDAVGFNCGTVSLDEYIELAERFVSAVKALSKNIAICAEPNAGKPELIEGRAVYNVSPEDFAAVAGKIHSAGVKIIGGCCGTGPAHIKDMAEILRG
jgi:5-methyltetrahydrofolate--homocysteine methyltransferase